MYSKEDDDKNVFVSNEKKLDSRTVRFRRKSFYLDVKQNNRGRFLKITEVVSSNKSRIILPLSIANKLKNYLLEFDKFYNYHVDTNPFKRIENEIILKSLTIKNDDRKYFLDLKQNDKGFFLRISQRTAQGFKLNYNIKIPAQCLYVFQEKLAELLVQYYNEEEDDVSLNVISIEDRKKLSTRQDTDKFLFDVTENKFGISLRISEVKPSNVSSVVIPEELWESVKDIFSFYCERSKKGVYDTFKNKNKTIEPENLTKS